LSNLGLLEITEWEPWAQSEWGRRGHGPLWNKLVQILCWCFISISTVRCQLVEDMSCHVVIDQKLSC